MLLLKETSVFSPYCERSGKFGTARSDARTLKPGAACLADRHRSFAIAITRQGKIERVAADSSTTGCYPGRMTS
jgi:hypothetical protein